VTLNSDNFITYAMKHYDNPQCVSLHEFEDDLKRLKYLNKLFSRYKKTGELKERLILNHIIVLFNVFGNCLLDILFFKIDNDHMNFLATFLVYLNRLPEEMFYKFKLDQNIVNALRKI
jgi:hypothetical protein